MNHLDYVLFCYDNGEVFVHLTHQPDVMKTELLAECPSAQVFPLSLPPRVEGEYDIVDGLRNLNPNAGITVQMALREAFDRGARAEKGKKGELSDLMLANLLNVALGDPEKDKADLKELLNSGHVSPALVTLLQEAWKLGQKLIQTHPDSPLEKAYYLLFSLEGASPFVDRGKHHVHGGHLIVHATRDLDHKEGELRALYDFLLIAILPCDLSRPGMEAMIQLLEESNLHTRTDGLNVVGSWIKDTLRKAFTLGAEHQRTEGISYNRELILGLLLMAEDNHPELTILPASVHQVLEHLMEEAWKKGSQFAEDHPEVNVHEM